MQQFEIILKNEKQKSYKNSLVVILFLNLIAFLFLAFVAKEKFIRNNCFGVAFGIAVALLLDFLFKKKIRADLRSGAILVIVYAYLMIGYYWLSITITLIYVLYLLAIRKSRVQVSEKSILYPSLVNRKIKWESLNNIMLKDDILTIDFKNNKLIQHHSDPSFLTVNEQDFNDFCKEQLALAASRLT